MRLLIAIFLPFLLFLTIGRPVLLFLTSGRPVAGIVCLIPRISPIGWIPAALRAVYALGQWRTDRKIAASR